LENTKLIGNDIPGAMFSDSPNVESCMSACNKNENCSGFVYDTTGQTSTCIPKDNKPPGMYTPATGVNTYVRDKTFIELPHGIYNTVNNIDSIQYENYVKGNNNDVNYGLTNITSVQKNQLQQLEDKLKQLSSQLNTYTNKLSENNNILDVTAKQNINKFNDSVTDFSEVKNKIKSFDTNNNIDNILNQVKINTLQKNYSYIFWCILAIVVVIITIYVRSYSSSQI
jgi:lipopolysaccharide export LptBFGC system permease protein LptF